MHASLRGRFVAVKMVEQQFLLSIHRARDLLVRQRTRLINGLRGMVAEFGVYIAKGLARTIGFAEGILAGEVLDMPEAANEVVNNLCEHLMALHARVRWYEDRLKQIAKEDARVRLWRTIPGVGAVTASALARRHWRPDVLQERKTVCGLAGARSQTQLQWRQVALVWDQQTR